MPDPKPKMKGKGILGSLTEKKGPLPVWAWAVIASVILFFLYKHFKGSSSASQTPASTATDATQPDTSGTDSGGGDFSGSGGGGSEPDDTSGDLSNTNPFSTGFELPYGYGGGQGFPNGVPDVLPSGTNPSATTGVGGLGALDWGGQQFTSRASFESWLSGHGGSIAQFSVLHPAAYAHYLALPAGKPKVKATKKTTAKPTGVTKSSKTKALTQAVKKVATGTARTGTAPKKTSIISSTKKPLSSLSHTVTQLGSNGRTTALHPASLVGGESNKVKTAPKPTKVIKAPAKSTVKPAPVAHPVAQNTRKATPPKKASKK